MIKVENLCFKIKGKSILKNVTTEIQKGKFTTIIGPNGCGKSTLIKSVVGHNKYSGNVEVDNMNRKDYTRKDFAKKVATLMQVQCIPIGMTVRELVAQGRHPYRSVFSALTTKDIEVIEWAMKITEVDILQDRYLETLSGGERQRVWLAMTLCQEPEILILDEPTNHLDLKYQYNLLKLVSKLNKEENITVVCVLHDITLAAKFSDEIIVLKSGELVAQGTPKECFTKELMHNVYDINANINFTGNNEFAMSIV